MNSPRQSRQSIFTCDNSAEWFEKGRETGTAKEKEGEGETGVSWFERNNKKFLHVYLKMTGESWRRGGQILIGEQKLCN